MQKIKQQDQKCLLARINPLKTFNLTFLCYCKLMPWFICCIKFKPEEKTTLQVEVKVISMTLKFLMWQKCSWAQTIPQWSILHWIGLDVVRPKTSQKHNYCHALSSKVFHLLLSPIPLHCISLLFLIEKTALTWQRDSTLRTITWITFQTYLLTFIKSFTVKNDSFI